MKFVVFLRRCTLIPVRFENSVFYRGEKTEKLKPDQCNLKCFFYLLCGNRFCFKCFRFLIYRLKRILLYSTKVVVFFQVVLPSRVKSYYYFWSSLFFRLYFSSLSFKVKPVSFVKMWIRTSWTIRKTFSRIGIKYLFLCAPFFLYFSHTTAIADPMKYCVELTRKYNLYWPEDVQCKCTDIGTLEAWRACEIRAAKAAAEEACKFNEEKYGYNLWNDQCHGTCSRCKESGGGQCSDSIEGCAQEAKKSAIKKCESHCKLTPKVDQGGKCKEIEYTYECKSFCAKEWNHEAMKVVEGFEPYDYYSSYFMYDISFENTIADGRQQCANTMKPELGKAYLEKCEGTLEAMGNGDRDRIFCPNNNCTAYCARKKDIYLDKLDYTPEKMVNFNVTQNLRLNCDHILLDAMQAGSIGDGSQIECLQKEAKAIKDSLVDSSGRLLDTAKQEGFRFLCKKDEQQECEYQLDKALNEAITVCADLQSEAHECCHEPEQCIGGGLAHALDGLGKLHVGLSQLRSQKKQCEAIRQTHGMYGGAQGIMAAQCIRKSNSCVRGCRQELNKVSEAFQEACKYHPITEGKWSESEHSCSKEFFDHYVKKYKSSENEKEISISKVPEQCKRTGQESNRRIQDMTTNLGASLLASVKECGQAAEEQGWEWSEPPPPSSNPVPPPSLPSPPEITVGSSDPEPSESDANESLLPPYEPFPSTAANPFDEEPDLPDRAPGSGKGVKGGVGGLLGGGSGGGSSGLGSLGGGGGREPRGTGGQPGRKKKKVLLGFKGGKFTGYGGGNSERERSRRERRVSNNKRKRGMASLDLKKLLPKGKQLNHKVGKYGSPHDDIFQRLSNRVQWMCRTNKISCKK